MPGYVRAAERRAQLLAAGEEVLVRDGLADLTLRAVAEQAGVRLSALQYIFPTRDELVTALTMHVLDKLAVTTTFESGEPVPLADSLDTADRGLEIELRNVVEWFATVGLATPAVVELVRHELVTSLSRDPGPHPYPLGGPVLVEGQRRRVQRIAKSGQEQWALPVDEIAELWADAIIGLVVQILREGDPATFRARGMRLVDHVVTVAQPRPA
jgi:AcrR family transcriptional regulator